jgi:NADH:ubiquinone oxidoreductase subunit 3 (subunit A)
MLWLWLLSTRYQLEDEARQNNIRKLTAAPIPRRQEHPLESAVGAWVHLETKVGVVVVLFIKFSSAVLFLTPGNVAPRAGTVVTVVAVVVLFLHQLMKTFRV